MTDRTPKWSTVEARCLEKLEGCRAALEHRETSFEEVQFERGKIAAYKDILALKRPHDESFQHDGPVYS